MQAVQVVNPPFRMDDRFLVFHTLSLKKCSGFLKLGSCGFIRVIRKWPECCEMRIMLPAWAKRIRVAGVHDVQKSFIKAASHVAILSWDVQTPCSVTCTSVLRGGRARMEKENLTAVVLLHLSLYVHSPNCSKKIDFHLPLNLALLARHMICKCSSQHFRRFWVGTWGVKSGKLANLKTACR